jgi:hypothetical protein
VHSNHEEPSHETPTGKDLHQSRYAIHDKTAVETSDTDKILDQNEIARDTSKEAALPAPESKKDDTLEGDEKAKSKKRGSKKAALPASGIEKDNTREGRDKLKSRTSSRIQPAEASTSNKRKRDGKAAASSPTKPNAKPVAASLPSKSNPKRSRKTS